MGGIKSAVGRWLWIAWSKGLKMFVLITSQNTPPLYVVLLYYLTLLAVIPCLTSANCDRDQTVFGPLLMYFCLFFSWSLSYGVLVTVQYMQILCVGLPRLYWMIYRGPGLVLPIVWSSLPPLPSLFLRLPVCRLSSIATEEGVGVWEEPNHTTARKPGPL